jgi:hypothetical protein
MMSASRKLMGSRLPCNSGMKGKFVCGNGIRTVPSSLPNQNTTIVVNYQLVATMYCVHRFKGFSLR